eukprot:1189928-Pleurochrysis_carterae.AAC.3
MAFEDCRTESTGHSRILHMLSIYPYRQLVRESRKIHRERRALITRREPACPIVHQRSSDHASIGSEMRRALLPEKRSVSGRSGG